MGYKRSKSHIHRHNSKNQCSKTYNNGMCGIHLVNDIQDKFAHTRSRTAESFVEDRDRSGGVAYAGARAKDHGSGRLSAEASAGLATYSKGAHEALALKGGAGVDFGMGGVMLEAGGDVTTYGFSDDVLELEVGRGYADVGAGIGAGGLKAKAQIGADAVREKLKFNEHCDLDASIGLNANTGVEIGVAGVGGTFLGLGFSVGKKTGIYTPFGGISFNLSL